MGSFDKKPVGFFPSSFGLLLENNLCLFNLYILFSRISYTHARRHTSPCLPSCLQLVVEDADHAKCCVAEMQRNTRAVCVKK